MTQFIAVTLHVFAVTPVKPSSKGYYIHLKLHDLPRGSANFYEANRNLTNVYSSNLSSNLIMQMEV